MIIHFISDKSMAYGEKVIFVAMDQYILSKTDAFFLVMTAVMLRKKKKNRTRRWSKEWYLLRHRFTHEHLQRALVDTEPDDFKNFLRMDEATYEYLLYLIRPRIEKQDTVMRQAIPVNQRLSVTLRYLVSGMDLEDLKFTCAIAPCTLGGIIIETCEAIIAALKENIQVPRSSEEWCRVAEGFQNRWNFPHCIGSVDGKHINIQKPANSGSYYYNYKQSYSIVLMSIVNSSYEFMMVDVGANGKVSDGGVLKNTEFWDRFSSNQLNIPQPSELPSTNQTLPYVLIGDEAFQLTSNFMKPYNQAVLTDERRIFNYRLSRARMVVENTFGILTTRFKIFKRNITLPPQKMRKIVLACCHLHNFLSKRRINYIRRDDVDFEDTQTGTIIPGS
ncbi:putative nuclease HARBI1 [Aricia agestis]|uniref:putative nuclease HARBI1 n=1 Tax=Aricia agestis TaxID=91739 RepID=UPI001C202EF1|nr:putative nuclease HARBI1 [Aricia agestis]